MEPPRLRRRLLVLAPLGILLGLALGVILSVALGGGWDRWLAARGIVPGYDQQGRPLPALEGRRLYLDCRGAGAPTIVLEAGMGAVSLAPGSSHNVHLDRPDLVIAAVERVLRLAGGG